MALGSQLPLENDYLGKGNKYLFPSSNVDPKYKIDLRGEYVKQMLEAMYAKYVNGMVSGNTYYTKADLLRAYGSGKQPEDIYQVWAYGGSAFGSSYISQLSQGIDIDVDTVQESLDKGWHNINWTVVSPAPKLGEMIEGMLDNVDFDIHADTLDAISSQKKENDKMKLLVKSKNMEWYNQQLESFGMPTEEEKYLPQRKEELELYDAYGGFKLQCARIQQMLIRYTYDSSGWDELKMMLLKDLRDMSRAIIKDNVNLDSKKIELEYVDPKGFFIQPSRYPDHRDSTFAGCIKEYDISYLASMGIPRDKLEAAARTFVGQFGNPTSIDEYLYEQSVGTGWFDYDFFKVAVLEGCWIEEDTKYIKFVKNRYGKVSSYETDFGYQPMKDNEWVKTKKNRMLYEGCWVVGTDITFSFGISYNQPKQDGRLKLPFHIYDLPNMSMTERCIPFYDEYMFCWLSFQNAMSLALPDGMAANMGMMANIELTKGKTANIIDIIKFARAHGFYPYNQSPTGRYEGGNPNPFTPVLGVTERILADLQNRLTICSSQIEQITGINPMNQPNATATGSQLAYNATINVLKPHVRGLLRIKESGAESVCWRIQNAIRNEPMFYQSYKGVLSENDLEIVKEAEGWGVRYGINLVARPSDDDVRNILEVVNLDVQQGLLDSNDLMFIREQLNARTDLILIRMYIQAKVSKNKEDMRKNQMEAIERQNQGNLQLRQVEGQVTLQKQQAETQKEQASIAAKHQGDMELNAMNNEARLKEIMLKLNDIQQSINVSR